MLWNLTKFWIFWNCEIRNFWEDPFLIVTYLQWRTHILKLWWRQQVYEHRNCSIPNWWDRIKTIGGSFYFDISMALQNHHDRVSLGKTFFNPLNLKDKVGCVFPMVIVSMLSHAEFGPNDYGEDEPHFRNSDSFTFAASLLVLWYATDLLFRLKIFRKIF